MPSIRLGQPFRKKYQIASRHHHKKEKNVDAPVKSMMNVPFGSARGGPRARFEVGDSLGPA
jgi:hypothetical protein